MTSESCPELPAHEALRLAAGGAGILDVRDPDEWAAGHAPLALHVPLEQLSTARTPNWRTQPVIVLCRSGSRAWSQAGGRVLADHGVGRVA